MKITDNYNAKYQIWGKESRQRPFPKAEIPFHIPSQKFSSYEEFNKWKQQLLIKIAQHGGVKWSK